ncbi:MAG TPA: phytanoyl-CoA dioxygenase family protein [Candidatus Angelobacter sp.]|nr:phytanoyl-CoA dioxygenase family protein [Candidatus Angelobacter sp.]
MKPEAGIGNPDAGGSLARDGFEIVPDVLPDGQCDIIASELSVLPDAREGPTNGRHYRGRNLLRRVPAVAQLASSKLLKGILESRLKREIFPVRALFFDKNADANWTVAWHQDLTIAVARKIETPGFGAWSIKEGIVHVRPPAEILENMATLRLHLDKCDADDGALKVIPRSHLRGRLDSTEIGACAEKNAGLICAVPKGGALLMRPLLLHSSSRAKRPVHRRVLHLEYASVGLPAGLEWFDS